MDGEGENHTNKKAFGNSRRLLSLPFSRSHSASDLSGTQAAGAGVHTLGGTVNDRLNAADVGLPATVGPSVRVGHTNAESNTLTAVITLCHCSAPPFVTSTYVEPSIVYVRTEYPHKATAIV